MSCLGSVHTWFSRVVCGEGGTAKAELHITVINRGPPNLTKQIKKVVVCSFRIQSVNCELRRSIHEKEI